MADITSFNSLLKAIDNGTAFSSAKKTLTNVLSNNGSLVGSTSKQSKDLRLIISPAGATAQQLKPKLPSLSNIMNNPIGTCSTTTGVPTGSGFYSGILAPLMMTNGVLFPFSPTVSFTQNVDYNIVGGGLVYTNQDYYAYQKTPNVQIAISGKFTVQNQYEGLYMLAVIQFFRTVSKMNFGEAASTSGQAGQPPPILILNGFGTYMFNKLPCILTSHSFDYNEDIDTIDVTDPTGGITKLPSVLSLQLTLIVQQTPYNMSHEFNLEAFKSGALIKSGGGWI